MTFALTSGDFLSADEQRISLPKAARVAARTLVRHTPGYDAWRASRGYNSDMPKLRILEAAKALGVWDKVEAIANGAARDPLSMGGAAMDEIEDAVEDEIEAVIGAGDDLGDDLGDDQGDDEAPAAPAIDPVQQVIDDVLGSARGVLADAFVQDIEKRLRPLVPLVARLNDRAETAEASARKASYRHSAAPVPGMIPAAKVVKTSTMRAVFGVSGAQGKLAVNLWDAQDAPRPDPGYVSEPSRFAEVVTAIENGESVWLAGAMGTGKGALAQEIAARLGRPFVKIGFTRATEIEDLRGQMEPVPSAGGVGMVWRDKQFTLAIRRPGTVILLDEIMIAPPGTVAFFQTILDNRELHLPTGEVVPFAEGVCVIAADNTAGYGDESQVYAGTQSANAALVDRFSRLVVIDYLPPALEALALAKRTGAPAAACKRLALFAEAVRAAAASAGGESRSYSYRRMTAFMGAVYRDKMAIERAWQVTMLTRLPEADRETFRVAVSAHFKEDLFRKELSGWTDAADAGDAPISTAPLSQSAEQVAARRLPDFQT